MRIRIALLLAVVSMAAQAQSNTTEDLHKRCGDARTFFFYNNTLRMINQTEDKNFDALIKDIEKMKLLIINKEKEKFEDADYKKLAASYKAEKFEEIMTTRHDGKSFNVFIKETGGKTKGMIVTVNDTEMMYVLDIVGSVALGNIQKFFSTLESSSDITKRIKQITDNGNEKEREKQ